MLTIILCGFSLFHLGVIVFCGLLTLKYTDKMEREEGEMSDDNAMHIDDVHVKLSMQAADTNHTTTYKADKNGLVIMQLEKVDASKLEERAKRFGLDLTGNRVVTQKQIDELYANCGIKSGNERHFRFDTLHLNMVDGLSTQEIFEYLEDFKPVSLEWIDDVSCNIVCHDHISAALALLVHSREIKREDLKEMLADKSHHHWREAVPHPKKDLILIRFATNGDKKINKKKPEIKHMNEFLDHNMDSVSNNPWGDLCKSWGVYDHQEIFQRKLPSDEDEDKDGERLPPVQMKNKRLAMRLGKRNHIKQESDDSSSDSEWKKKSKTPRMRMHADDEESKQKKRQSETYAEFSNKRDIYDPLSIEVVNSKKHFLSKTTSILSDKFKTNMIGNKVQKSSLQSRLGTKVATTEVSWSSDETSSGSTDHNIMSRVQKVGSKPSGSGNSNVWSRLDNKEDSAKTESDLRQIIRSKRQIKPDDLRDRLSKSKQSNLRIEIDNNYAHS